MNCISKPNTGRTENLVFLNKVFYDNRGVSCPVIYPLTTTGQAFTQQLIIGSGNSPQPPFSHCGCGCFNSCDFDLCNAQFTVTNSCVTITSVSLDETAEFTASDVTIDGFPVTSLTLENSRYIADLSTIMADLTKCPGVPADKRICGSCNSCSDCCTQCANDGHFFLAVVPGPWEMFLNITIDGYVSNGRCTRDFRLCMKTRSDATGQFPITVTSPSSFALNCVDIPCQSQGISPSLRFSFGSCGMLLNPVLTTETPADPPAGSCPAPVTLILSGSLVLTPEINLQVVRPSLFALNANEIGTCCDDLGQCDSCSSPSGCLCPDENSCEPVLSPPCPPAPSGNTCCQYCGDTNGFRF